VKNRTAYNHTLGFLQLPRKSLLKFWFENIRKRYKIRRATPKLWRFPDEGFAYLPIPKVATSSICASLLKTQGAKAGIADFKVFERQLSQHFNPEAIRGAADGLRLFAFVRHPLARLYSAYADKLIKAPQRGQRNVFACHGLEFGMAFDAFVARVCAMEDRQLDRHLRSQAWFLCDSNGLIPNFIGHLESFNADWDQLTVMIPTLGPIDHLNLAAGKTDFLRHYSPKSLALAQHRFARDFELFGYPLADVSA
jgi:dermatan 4-sulfotransferase 1